jgi:hypothetical protein
VGAIVPSNGVGPDTLVPHSSITTPAAGNDCCYPPCDPFLSISDAPVTDAAGAEPTSSSSPPPRGPVDEDAPEFTIWLGNSHRGWVHFWGHLYCQAISRQEWTFPQRDSHRAVYTLHWEFSDGECGGVRFSKVPPTKDRTLLAEKSLLGG